MTAQINRLSEKEIISNFKMSTELLKKSYQSFGKIRAQLLAVEGLPSDTIAFLQLTKDSTIYKVVNNAVYYDLKGFATLKELLIVTKEMYALIQGLQSGNFTSKYVIEQSNDIKKGKLQNAVNLASKKVDKLEQIIEDLKQGYEVHQSPMLLDQIEKKGEALMKAKKAYKKHNTALNDFTPLGSIVTKKAKK